MKLLYWMELDYTDYDALDSVLVVAEDIPDAKALVKAYLGQSAWSAQPFAIGRITYYGNAAPHLVPGVQEVHYVSG